MDVEHKKTALSDDSEIYKSRDNSFGKKDLRSLSGKQRLEYFKDYYLLKVIVALVVVIFAGALLNATVFNRATCVLSIAFLDESQISEQQALEEALAEYLGGLEKNDYVSVESFNTEDYQMNMAYMAKTAAGGIDAVVCTRDYFEKAAERGMLIDLREVLPEDMYAELSDRMLEGKAIKDEDEEGNALSYYDPCPYGIDISGSAHFAEFGGMESAPVFCVTQSDVNRENLIKAITYFSKTGK
ncbi:MAG: hypothetical protein Q4C61_00405 [Lachnospiraceae bacterium]|nr:hypothetical protein [Lachnospiraceae bacterium]